MVTKLGEIVGALEAEPWFAGRIGRLAPLIAQHGRIRHFRRGEVIYQSGDPPTGIFLVLEGVVRLYHYSVDGREALVAIHEHSRWFGELSEVDGLERTHTAIAGQSARVVVLSSDQLARVLEAAPEFSGFLTQLLAAHLRAALGIIIERRELPADAQIARILTEGPAGGRGERQQAITQGDLASMVGVSRQTISKILHRFRDEGLVTLRYRHVSVLDEAGLEALIRDNC